MIFGLIIVTIIIYNIIKKTPPSIQIDNMMSLQDICTVFIQALSNAYIRDGVPKAVAILNTFGVNDGTYVILSQIYRMPGHAYIYEILVSLLSISIYILSIMPENYVDYILALKKCFMTLDLLENLFMKEITRLKTNNLWIDPQILETYEYYKIHIRPLVIEKATHILTSVNQEKPQLDAESARLISVLRFFIRRYKKRSLDLERFKK